LAPGGDSGQVLDPQTFQVTDSELLLFWARNYKTVTTSTCITKSQLFYQSFRAMQVNHAFPHARGWWWFFYKKSYFANHLEPCRSTMHFLMLVVDDDFFIKKSCVLFNSCLLTERKKELHCTYLDARINARAIS
jgi:hypothetical protein